MSLEDSKTMMLFFLLGTLDILDAVDKVPAKK